MCVCVCCKCWQYETAIVEGYKHQRHTHTHSDGSCTYNSLVTVPVVHYKGATFLSHLFRLANGSASKRRVAELCTCTHTGRTHNAASIVACSKTKRRKVSTQETKKPKKGGTDTRAQFLFFFFLCSSAQAKEETVPVGALSLEASDAVFFLFFIRRVQAALQTAAGERGSGLRRRRGLITFFFKRRIKCLKCCRPATFCRGPFVLLSRPCARIFRAFVKLEQSPSLSPGRSSFLCSPSEAALDLAIALMPKERYR